MLNPPGAETGPLRGVVCAVGYLPAERSLAVDNPQLPARTVQHPLDELFRVTARRCQQRDEVAGMGVLYVVAGSAVVPQQPPLDVGRRRRGPDELGGIRAQQNIRCTRDTGERPLQDLRVALIIFDDQIDEAVEFSPDLQGPRGLSAETRVAARQRQARADTYPAIRVIGHRRPSRPRSGTHAGRPPRWFPAPPPGRPEHPGWCGGRGSPAPPA